MLDIRFDERLPNNYSRHLWKYVEELHLNNPILNRIYTEGKISKKPKSNLNQIWEDIEREEKQERKDNISSENSTFGGLHGEEAEIARWNCD